jgi:DNA repair protein RadC
MNRKIQEEQARKLSCEGHRERLRKKFLDSGVSAFHDYELIELLLTLGTPRRDCKQQAKNLLAKFKTLRGVLEADAKDLQKVKDIGPINAIALKIVHEVARKFLEEKAIAAPDCKSSQEVFDYLYHSMRDLKKEVFKVLFLNGKNKILAIEDLFEGTLNQSAVYPREIMKKAISNNAVGLIFAHNHPSGDPTPSQSDKDITKDLISAGKTMDIKVFDHIIIGDNKYYSFADKGMI